KDLTRKITGDMRPKQFCRLFGDRSLLGHTRERLRPIFRDDRTLFVVSKSHEVFYRDELSEVNASSVVAQPANRIGHASAFLELLCSTIPDAMVKIADALAHNDLDSVYLDLDSIDFSMAVLSREPHRLLVMPDAASGWTDLGEPERVIDAFIQNQIKP